MINDPALHERAEILREKGTDRARFFRGMVDKYSWIDIGSSYLLADVNAAIAAKREVAAAEAAAARAAASGDIAAAVMDVTSRTLELSIGNVPDGAAVRSAVDSAMSAGVSS